jgi:hypothetical protein
MSACYILHLQGKGKGKGGASQYGYGKGKGRGGYYGGDDSVLSDDNAGSDDFVSRDDDDLFFPFPNSTSPGCVQVAFQEEFQFRSANLAIPPSTNDPNEIGTTFIYAPSPVFSANDTNVELEDQRISGVCTRTLEPFGGDGGGGVCQFTIQLGGSSVTFGGFIEDYVLGNSPPTLSITGGSGENIGTTGEVALLPLDGTGAAFTGDIFFDATVYQAFVFGFVLICDVIEGF